MKKVTSARTETKIRDILKKYSVAAEEFNLSFFENVLTNVRHAVLTINFDGYSLGRATLIHEELEAIKTFSSCQLDRDSLRFTALFI